MSAFVRDDFKVLVLTFLPLMKRLVTVTGYTQHEKLKSAVHFNLANVDLI